jgi:hypothetical protein
MATSYTFGDMATRIADELARTDLDQQIRNSIRDAIRHYERRRFPWNESVGLFSTKPGREYYDGTDLGVIPDLIAIDSLTVTQNASIWPLMKRSFADIEGWATATLLPSGTPTDYCYYARSIRVYPVPAAVLPMRLSAVVRLPWLQADADTNPWLNDGEELVRTKAKVLLLRNVIRGEEEMAEADVLNTHLHSTESRLQGENQGRISTGVRAWGW